MVARWLAAVAESLCPGNFFSRSNQGQPLPTVLCYPQPCYIFQNANAVPIMENIAWAVPLICQCRVLQMVVKSHKKSPEATNNALLPPSEALPPSVTVANNINLMFHYRSTILLMKHSYPATCSICPSTRCDHAAIHYY